MFVRYQERMPFLKVLDAGAWPRGGLQKPDNFADWQGIVGGDRRRPMSER